MDERSDRRRSVLKVQLYVEGAGQKAADIRLREGFRGLIARDSGEDVAKNVRIVACGNTSETYKDFCHGIQTSAQPFACLAILVDSDMHVASDTDGWQAIAHLQGCGPRPNGAVADSAHLMTRVMESWIVTDPDNLSLFYGPGFNPKQLIVNPDIEQVPKADVYARLKEATKNTKSGDYHKTKHGFDLIRGTDPVKLRSRSFRAGKFLDFVRAKATN